jgi:hypothetical protein
VFSVVECLSISWCDEIIWKYAEGVRGLKPRVKRSGTVGYYIRVRSALKERQMLAGLYRSAWLGEFCSKTGKHEGLRAFSPHGSIVQDTRSPGTNVCRSFRARRLLHISNPGFRFAPPRAEVYYAFGVSQIRFPNKTQCNIPFLRSTDTLLGGSIARKSHERFGARDFRAKLATCCRLGFVNAGRCRNL